MTSIFPDHPPDTRIFVLSALGSLLVHGLLLASLATMSQSTIVKDEPPTVQVRLMPSSEVLQAPQPPTPLQQPRTAIRETPPTTMPRTQPHQSQPPASPSRSAPATPVIQETRAVQIMKAREMMKMRLPTQAQQTSPTLPTMSRRTNTENGALPPLPSITKEHSAARSLPAPPTLTTPRTLTATPPAQTGTTMTRPTIISSSKPVYPRVARESGWEGTVIVRTLIDTDGIPSQVTIRKSCGQSILDQAAQDAVKSWIFQPAKDGNIPIAKWVDIPINFDLNS